MKAAFIPKLDAFVSSDYANIEAKLLAFYLDSVGYPEMAEVFRTGADLHKQTAAGIFGKPADQINDAERQVGKRLLFSLIYGGGVPTLVRQGVAADGKEAMELLRAFHKSNPGIGWESKRGAAQNGTLVAEIKKRLEQRGYVTTLFGRHLRPREPHKALNALIQGCAADLAKQALVEIHKGLKSMEFRSHLVWFVHDEVILDCVEDELDAVAETVPLWMTDPGIDEVVPIMPECEISRSTLAEKEPFDRRIHGSTYQRAS